MKKYVVAIVGFAEKEKAVAAIEEFMKEQRLWLFTVAGSGDGISKEVADYFGAPFQWCKSLKELEYTSNYLVADVSGGQEVKNFVLKWKASGKHGKVVK